MTDGERAEVHELREEFESFRKTIYLGAILTLAGMLGTAIAAALVVGGYLSDVDDNRKSVGDLTAALQDTRERVAVVESGMPRVEQRLVRIEGRLDDLLAELRRSRHAEPRAQ